MTLRDWADASMYTLINYSNCYALLDDNWQLWGTMFFNDPYLSRFDPPNPYEFTQWEVWAERLLDAMGPAAGSPKAAA